MSAIARGCSILVAVRYCQFITSLAGRGDEKIAQSFNQSNRVMQTDCLNSLPKQGVGLCSHEINQSETGMQIDNRRPVCVSKIHCLRPESLRNSHLIPFSSFANLKSIVMNQPPGINQTTTDLNSTLTQLDSQTLFNSTAEKADLLTFVESIPLNFPNFRQPSLRPPMRSRQLSRISRLGQIRQRNRTRERAASFNKLGS